MTAAPCLHNTFENRMMCTLARVEWQVASHHCKGHYAKAPHICRWANVALAPHNFWRRIAWRPAVYLHSALQ